MQIKIKNRNYPIKPLFEQRMKALLKDEKDYEKFLEYSKKEPVNSIRCNTLKISVKELKERLENKGWVIRQPFPNHPKTMIVESDLFPGELGKSIEHLLGYYYVQEITSMMPIIALNPKPGELFLDLCAAPGSKTTQTASFMNNKGMIIANDANFKRIKILGANLGRCGVMNTIITKKDGSILCEKFRKAEIEFDKILVDASCSGEGTLRSSPKTFLTWNIKMINKFSRAQKRLIESAFKVLKSGGTLIYSTCTHSPEENEEVVDYVLNQKEFKDKIKVEKISLPIKTRPGITDWDNKKYSYQVKNCIRIYPQDNDTEGFFLAKIKKL